MLRKRSRPQPFVSSSFTFYVTYARLFTVRFTLADFPRPLILRGIRDTRPSIEKTATADRLCASRSSTSPSSSSSSSSIWHAAADGSASNRLAERREHETGRETTIPFVMFDLARLAGLRGNRCTLGNEPTSGFPDGFFYRPSSFSPPLSLSLSRWTARTAGCAVPEILSQTDTGKTMAYFVAP